MLFKHKYLKSNFKNPPEEIKQVNSLLFIQPKHFGNFKKSIFYKYHADMIYTNKGLLLATLSHVMAF